jgi:hypothetical protein
MVHTGILIPADYHELPLQIHWEKEGELLPLLYRHIGQNLDASTICGPERVPGGLRLWCQDDGLLKAEPEYNDRAIALCRWVGYDVDALAGPILIIGSVHGENETGLNSKTLAWLLESLDRMVKTFDEIERGKDKG